MRNLLAAALLSTGVPMIAAGDEMGRTQRGNNNAYCRDDDVSWVDWDLGGWQRDLLATTTHLLRLRREHPALRHGRFFSGRPNGGGAAPDLVWFDAHGRAMDDERWHDPANRTLLALLDGSVLLVLHGGGAAARVTTPGAPWAGGYRLLWDSSQETPLQGDWTAAGHSSLVPPRSTQVLEARPELAT